MEHRILWRSRDVGLESRVIKIWQENAVLPKGVSPEDRAAELVIVAMDGETVAGMTTAKIGLEESLRHKFAFFRVFVAPDYRRSDLMVPLVVATFDCLQNWSRQNPDERVAGLGSVRENPVLDGPRFQTPLTPTIGAMLVGYNDADRPIRVKWFSHICV